MTHETRESWLLAAARALDPVLQGADLGVGDIRVSCGWPARGALSSSKRRVGECWPGSLNKDGQAHIFVSPCKDNSIDVLGILLHELIHAALPAKVRHGPTFARAAKRVGLTGKPTATVVGEELAVRLNTMAAPLGPYPHSAIDAQQRTKQTTRLRLYLCACTPGQGITNKVRVASDTWQATCDRCTTQFNIAGSSNE